jgi:hypothetical protein
MRAIAVALVALAGIGCLNEPTLPDEAPGLPVSINAGGCGSSLGRCLVWSADSRTLYAAQYLGSAGYALVAMDPATREARTIGQIDEPSWMEPSPDGLAVFYSSASGVSRYRINRYALAEASAEQLVDDAGSSDFKVSGDGRRIVYRTAGANRASDTIAVFDRTTRSRVAASRVADAVLNDVSPDGAQVAFTLIFSNRGLVWNLVTNTQLQLPMPTNLPPGRLADIEWAKEDLRGLVMTYGPTSIPTDVRFGTLETVAYVAVRKDGQPMAWLPESRELFLAITDLQCESSPPCGIRHFDLIYTSAAGASLMGSVNAALFTAFAPSPDGRWLAYKVLDRPMYLIRR